MRSREVNVKFCEMDNLSDPIIIGCPELQAWGFMMEPRTDTGLSWVQFTTLNIALPLVAARAGQHIQVLHPLLIAGPDAVEVPVVAVRRVVQDLVQ